MEATFIKLRLNNQSTLSINFNNIAKDKFVCVPISQFHDYTNSVKLYQGNVLILPKAASTNYIYDVNGINLSEGLFVVSDKTLKVVVDVYEFDAIAGVERVDLDLIYFDCKEIGTDKRNIQKLKLSVIPS